MNNVPSVRDIMVPTTLSLSPEMSAHEAVDILVSKKIPGLPVIDDAGRLAGFLTEKDCLRLQFTSHQYNMTGRKVKDIMSKIKAGLHADMDLFSAASQFLACDFPTLPVLDGDTLVGSITRLNMLEAIQKMFAEAGKSKEHEKAAQKMVDNPSSIGQLQALVGKSSKQQLAAVFAGRHKS